jgi:arylsulfatase A-like enzyme
MGNVGREHGWAFAEDSRHAARIFGEAGYQTWVLGMQHETWKDPKTLGFDVVDTGFPVMAAAEHLAAQLDARDESKPFYCQIGCHETHRPFLKHGTEPDDHLGITVPPYLVDGDATREDLAALQGSVKTLDRGLGAILDLLEKRRLLDNTILVVTTDHGLSLPRAKCTLYDAGTEVLLFVRDPRSGQLGRRCDELVSHVDILPTLVEACGLSQEAQFEGQGFMPLLEGEKGERDAVFSEKTFFQFYDPMRSVRTKRFRFIQNFELCRYLEMDSGGKGEGSFCDFGTKAIGGHPQDELYDVEADPHMLTNLAVAEEYGEVVCEHKRMLLEWMERTDDPLLKGHVPSPYHQRVVEELRSS